ncbi:MAG: peptide chain release factor N(5)-glutamine methyltransferase [Armatimonadetes bacterium]|nr:peptide chain release factor N(5)-glutamine methyltransferase [Armatimonadota bacterium]
MAATPGVVSLGSLVQSAVADLARAGVETPRLEAELLAAQAMGWTRLQVMTRREHGVSVQQAADLRGLYAARCRRAPLAYLAGRREFYGLGLRVGPGVLTPRPETELLVDLALDEARRRGAVRLADVCTGSGCVAVALAIGLPDARLLATDLSHAAIRCAARNATEHGVADRLGLVRCDLTRALRPGWAEILVANPPYVPSAATAGLQPEVACYEPWVALDGGGSGLTILEALAIGARRVLGAGGLFASEIGSDQGDAALRIVRAVGFGRPAIVRDLAGMDRVVTARA